MKRDATQQVNLFISYGTGQYPAAFMRMKQELEHLAFVNHRRAYDLRIHYDRQLYRNPPQGRHLVNLKAADLIVVFESPEYSELFRSRPAEPEIIVESALNKTKKIVLLGYERTNVAAQAGNSGLRRIPADPEIFLKDNPTAEEYWTEFRTAIHQNCLTIAAEKKRNPPAPATLPADQIITMVSVEPVAGEEADMRKKELSGFTLTVLGLLLVFGLFASAELLLVQPAPVIGQLASMPINLPYYGTVAGGRAIPPTTPVTGQSTSLAAVSTPTPAGNASGINSRNYRQLPATYGKGVFRTESYGQYESCQGLDAQGFKPCKKNRRWYIVNEGQGVHHRINFDVETHKDIFAIRPFRAGLAQVFFYDGRVMYLAFCVGLDDRVLECSISA